MAQVYLLSTDSLLVSRFSLRFGEEDVQKSEEPIGRYYTPIICPQRDLRFSEPEGRIFHIPVSFLGADKKFGEGERVPFHYLYCVTGVDWILWHQENAEEQRHIKTQKLEELLQRNYDFLVSEEEKAERANLLGKSLSLQRENHPLVDSFRLNNRYNILMSFAEYIGNDELYDTAGWCFGESVIGFTPKDFRIVLDLEDVITTEEKLALAKELPDLVIN